MQVRTALLLPLPNRKTKTGNNLEFPNDHILIPKNKIEELKSHITDPEIQLYSIMENIETN
jgi:hypothetical protein